MRDYPLVIVGAGVAGLALARHCRAQGIDFLLVDRSPEVGGRIATRTLDGKPFDYGPVFLHGRDPQFLQTVGALGPDRLIPDWPRRLEGEGSPCQPEAFAPQQQRWAWRGGLRPVLQELSEGLPLKTGVEVRSLRLDGERWVLETEGLGPISTPRLVLTLAHEQTLQLLRAVDHARVRNLVEGLSLHASLACLSVAALYPAAGSEPGWDVFYPREGLLQLISHETAKHGGGGLLLVYQAKPSWSKRHAEDDPQAWSRELLQEAGRILGSWAAEPERIHPHRWKYARMDAASTLPHPVTLVLEKVWLGLAGDLYHPNRGVEGAWLSGLQLATWITENARC